MFLKMWFYGVLSMDRCFGIAKHGLTKRPNVFTSLSKNWLQHTKQTLQQIQREGCVFVYIPLGVSVGESDTLGGVGF